MSHFERRERLRFGEALTSRLDAIEQPTRASWWGSLLAWLGGPRLVLKFSIAVGALLVAVGGFWFFTEVQRRASDELALAPDGNNQSVPVNDDSRQREPLQEVRGAVEPDPQPSRPASSPKPSVSPNAHSGPRSVSLALTMGGVRGGDSSQVPLLVIPRGTAQARLLLSLKENAYSSYRLSLKDMLGIEVASRSITKPNSSTLVLTVPAGKLSDGDYVLALTGVEADGAVDDLSKSLVRVKKRN